MLLNIASKVHAILINRALRSLSAKIVPESQIGFQKGHGSADGHLVIRRVLECFRTMSAKGVGAEHDQGVYTLFVDLKINYLLINFALLAILLTNYRK